MQTQDAEAVQNLINKAKQTPKGQKKDVGGEMFKGYTPAAVEAGWWVLHCLVKIVHHLALMHDATCVNVGMPVLAIQH